MQSAGAESTAMNDIVAGIYEAGVNPVLWGEVMPQLSGMVGGAGIAFGAIHLQRGLLLFPEHNFSPDCMRGVLERYHTPSNNPGVKFAASTAPLTITSLDSVVSDSELVRTDFYNDLMRPQKYWHGLLANVFRDLDHFVSLASYRTASAGTYDDGETARLAMVLPHLNRSIRTFLRLNAVGALVRAETEIINRLPQGIIVTDATGRIGFANSAAHTIIADRDGLTIRNGILHASRRKETEQLARLIADAAGIPAANARAAVKRYRARCKCPARRCVNRFRWWSPRCDLMRSRCRTILPSRSRSAIPSGCRKPQPKRWHACTV